LFVYWADVPSESYKLPSHRQCVAVTCKLKMTLRLIIIQLFFSAVTFGQTQLVGKFIDDHINENTYIIFNSDSTFKYRYSFDLFLDIKCGQYKTKGDTIYLTYTSGINDTLCNTEQIMPLVASDTISRRPTQLYLKGDKLFEIKDGKIVDRTEKFQPDWKVPKSSRKYYRRKYLLFGPLVSKTKKIYYMIAASKVKWTKHK